MNSNHVWVVTFHFSRGNAQTNWFNTKKDAQDAINVTVFNNEDCVNCSIHKQEVQVSDAVKQANRLFEIRDRILGKM